MSRIKISLDEENLDKLEAISKSLGLTKSEFVVYAVNGYKKEKDPMEEDYEMVRELADISTYIKALVLNNKSLTGDEKIMLFQKIDDVKEIAKNYWKGM